MQAATCYYQSQHSKIEAITITALSKDISSKLAVSSSKSSKEAVNILTFYVFCFGMARRDNRIQIFRM